MDAFSAIPILDKAIRKLEAQEHGWKNCRQCPHQGKCCDGADLRLYPEEAKRIREYLQSNPAVRDYALQRRESEKWCWFYDRNATKCLIHEVRPINCRWTPYTLFSSSALDRGRYRLPNCDFMKVGYNDVLQPSKNYLVTTSRRDLKLQNRTYILLQAVKQLHPLLERSNEFMTDQEQIGEFLFASPIGEHVTR